MTNDGPRRPKPASGSLRSPFNKLTKKLTTNEGVLPPTPRVTTRRVVSHKFDLVNIACAILDVFL